MDALHAYETEQACMGAAMTSPEAAQKVASMPDDMFSAPAARAAQKAIRTMLHRGLAVELLTLSEETGKECPGCEVWLMEALRAGGVMPSYLPQWTAILDDRRRRRALTTMATGVLGSVTDMGTSPEQLRDKAIAACQVESAQAESTDMMTATTRLLDSLGEKRSACSTGIADLDRLTGGIRGGKLVVIGARPGVGKTALALHIAAHVARHTGTVLIVSLEMDETEITARLVAAHGGLDVQMLESGRLTEADWLQVTPAAAEVSHLPIRLTMASTPMQVRREAHRVKAEQGLAMVVVDYIQLMHADGKRASRYEEVSEISRELKLLAMDLGVPVIALTQFNRESEAGKNGQANRRPPRMAEAKDSGSIEQDANLFIVQYAPGAPDDDPRSQQAATMCKGFGHEWQQLIVEKNRQGRTGIIDVGFDKPHMRFVNLRLEG